MRGFRWLTGHRLLLRWYLQGRGRPKKEKPAAAAKKAEPEESCGEEEEADEAPPTKKVRVALIWACLI